MAATAKPMAAADVPPIQELTREESRQFFDAQARKLIGMSGEEFLRRLDAEEFDAVIDDPQDHPHVGYLAMLSPIGR